MARLRGGARDLDIGGPVTVLAWRKIGRNWFYGPLRKGERARITWALRNQYQLGDWHVDAHIRGRWGFGGIGGSCADLDQAKKRVEDYVAAKRTETKKAKAPKQAKEDAAAKAHAERIDAEGFVDDDEPAESAPRGRRRKVEPRADTPEPTKLPEAPKTPRMQELLDLETEIRAALDSLENEHKIELHEDEPPRCSQLYEHEQDGELARSTEELEIPLTKEEQFLAGQEAATALFAQRRLDDLKKAVGGTLKSLIDRYEERVLALLGRVDTGKASVPVTVITVRTSSQTATVFRADTWKVLRKRDLTAEEKQLRFG